MLGPELKGYVPSAGIKHDLEHLTLHLTCTALGACQHFGVPVRHPLRDARRFCDTDYLDNWLERRDLKDGWFEGNNILFVGQLLVWLRDVEGDRHARMALNRWFEWLDSHADLQTGLWGTDKGCSTAHSVYGSYHQLLVYYHEGHSVPNPKALIDVVLELQHSDGGFNPNGNGGACEDVDCVDILTNLYKRVTYRRPEIRNALRRCIEHILFTQNDDGGFPYNRDHPQSHMGIPATKAQANESTTFSTWFRIHTLALCAEILPDHSALNKQRFHFSKMLSMGWHTSPPDWTLGLTVNQRIREGLLSIGSDLSKLRKVGRRHGGKLLRSAGLR